MYQNTDGLPDIQGTNQGDSGRGSGRGGRGGCRGDQARGQNHGRGGRFRSQDRNRKNLEKKSTPKRGGHGGHGGNRPRLKFGADTGFSEPEQPALKREEAAHDQGEPALSVRKTIKVEMAEAKEEKIKDEPLD